VVFWCQFDGVAQPVESLLTTRQIQELLRVDRITVYRMLKDGRLRGFKVGGQWRFPRREIESWLQEQQARPDSAPALSWATENPAQLSQALPLSCIGAIQTLCAEAMDVAVIATNLDGIPVSGISNSCDFCSAILATAEGQRRCSATWKNADDGQVHNCHAGLFCIGVPFRVGAAKVAIVATCQFAEEGWQADLPALANDLGLKAEELAATLGSVRLVRDQSLDRISRCVKRMADTFSQIGQERLELLGRLRHIAQVSTI
jgi:excisionase family DNA binding protein